MISTNQFRNGSAIRVDGKRFTILYFQHVKPGKGGAFVRTKLKNLETGAVVDSGEGSPEATVNRAIAALAECPRAALPPESEGEQ